MPSFRYHVFLSHNSADKPAVEELAHRLKKEGLEPWLDKWHLVPGDPWQPAVERALDDCQSCAVFIGPSHLGPWQHEEMRRAIDRRVGETDRKFRVVPVLLPGGRRGERTQLPAFLVAATWVEFLSLDDAQAFHRLLCGIRGQAPGPGPGAVPEGECPYRGLEYFDVAHAPYFCGRAGLTDWLLEKLRPSARAPEPPRFLAVVGASGSGKSSLARAGLLARLKQGALYGSAAWPVAVCRPGPDPLESLAVALAGAGLVGPDPGAALAFKEGLARDRTALHLAARLGVGEGQRLVLLVDQFEEVFTLCPAEAPRRAFLDNLLHAGFVPQGRVLVLLTMRADFYGKCASYAELSAALSDHQELVGPMGPQELREAIEWPAQRAGCEFEAGLVELLVRDVQDQPGGLPLLQHALKELWQRREGRRLTLAAYRASGGVAGALQKRADHVYDCLPDAQKEICRRIFLRLTQPGEGTEDTRRRVPLRELQPAQGLLEPVEQVVQALADADARLVMTEGERGQPGGQWVEVAHEALIRGWPRLRGWIEADRQALRRHRRLTEAAQAWAHSGRNPSYLYWGTRLAAARAWAGSHAGEMNPLEQAFLQTSVRRRRWQLAGLWGAVVLGMLVLGAAAVREKLLRDEADGQTDLAQQHATRAENRRQILLRAVTRARLDARRWLKKAATVKQAAGAFRTCVDLLRAAYQQDRTDKEVQEQLAEALSNLAWAELLNRRPADAVADARDATNYAPRRLDIQLNLAHSYLLDDQPEEAEKIYRRYKDAVLPDGKTFAQQLLEDLAVFQDRRLVANNKVEANLRRIEKGFRARAN
jgi:hypothetical protein